MRVTIMGEAKRRRAAGGASLQNFHDEAAFAGFTLDVLNPLDLVTLIDKDRTFGRYLGDWFDQIDQIRPMCIDCDTVFTKERLPTAWVIARPSTDSPRQTAILMGACAACCDKYPTWRTLVDATGARMSQLWSGALREVDPANMPKTRGSA
jgi:hypothetical protein